jgi:prophage regulatory protein
MSQQQILRPKQAAAYLGTSLPTLYRWCAAGRFPAPIKLGARSSGWFREELDEFLAERKAERDSARKAA